MQYKKELQSIYPMVVMTVPVYPNRRIDNKSNDTAIVKEDQEEIKTIDLSDVFNENDYDDTTDDLELHLGPNTSASLSSSIQQPTTTDTHKSITTDDADQEQQLVIEPYRETTQQRCKRKTCQCIHYTSLLLVAIAFVILLGLFIRFLWLTNPQDNEETTEEEEEDWSSSSSSSSSSSTSN